MENSKCQCNLLLDNFPSKSLLFHSRVIRFPLFRTQLIRTKPVSNFDTSLLGNVFDVAAKFFDRNRGPSPSRFGKIVKKKRGKSEKNHFEKSRNEPRIVARRRNRSAFSLFLFSLLCAVLFLFKPGMCFCCASRNTEDPH